MDREQIQEIIFRVLSEFGNWMPGREPELEFPVEVSAKHVHLTDKAVEVLFGWESGRFGVSFFPLPNSTSTALSDPGRIDGKNGPVTEPFAGRDPGR